MSVDVKEPHPSEKARMVIKAYKPSQWLKLATKQYYFTRAIAVITLVPLFSSLFMFLFMTNGAKKIVFLALVIFLFFVSLFTWQYKRLLVLDGLKGQGYIRTTFFGTTLKTESNFDLNKTEVVIKPYIVFDKTFQFSILKHEYPFGNYSETKEILHFISNEFGLLAMDGVSDFPKTRPFENRKMMTPETPNEAANTSQSATSKIPIDSSNIWTLGMFLKLALPFPAFVVIGLLIGTH